MTSIQSISRLRSELKSARDNGLSIGLVPTMGALHRGHASLIEKSRRENDVTVCSIFVNPTQFNNQDDLLNYPRQNSADLDLLRSLDCDIAFIPSVEEMYGSGYDVKVSAGDLETVLEGVHRPGHFSGVGVIITKLFNIVQPDVAYFGQKDLQQLAVIRKITQSLLFPIRIESVATVREDSGLAMSSRNLRLSKEEIQIASNIYKVLMDIKESIDAGESLSDSLKKGELSLKSVEGLEIEYLEIVDSDTMLPAKTIESGKSISICVAAYVGEVRLIDNINLNH